MSRILSTLIPVSTLLAGGLLLPCQAVYGQSVPYDRPYGDRDTARQDRSMFDRVRMDLDRASAYPYASPADHKRFDEARSRLFDFASRFEEGRYNKHQFNEAIDCIQRVVSKNSLDPRERGALEEDLRRMRDYREFRNHNYGYR